MNEVNKVVNSREEIISFQKLRTFIGLIGILLPFILVMGCYLKHDEAYSWQHSISHYYYSKMHIVFVGLLCILGGFLINYRGKDRAESIVANIAGSSAFSIAIFPTPYDGFQANGTDLTNQYLQLCREIAKSLGYLHFAFAGLLFLCFIIFCWHFFQIPDTESTNSIELMKFKRRQHFYIGCGIGIAISIVFIAYFQFFLQNKTGWKLYSTFIFETTSLWSFGLAWLMKGSANWKKYPLLKNVISYWR